MSTAATRVSKVRGVLVVVAMAASAFVIRNPRAAAVTAMSEVAPSNRHQWAVPFPAPSLASLPCLHATVYLAIFLRE